jgi:hypothetical protein
MKMYIAIPKKDTKVAIVYQDDEERFNEIREKAMFDWTSGVNHARREGIKEGKAEGRAEIIELLKSGKTPEEIIRDYSDQ